MRRVGNDVVDLGAAAARRPERFIARVCAPSERALLERAADPHRLLWSLFAAKEAAFKVVCKLGPRPTFAHRLFVVGDALEKVRYGPHTLALRLDTDAERVHAVATAAPPYPEARVARLALGQDPGAAARALLVDLLAARLGCPPSELEVVRAPLPEAWDGLGPPRVLRGGAPVADDVSLSHDGRFVACVA